MQLHVRPVADEDVEPLVDLTLLAFSPNFESFQRILGPPIYCHIWPDWKAEQRKAVVTMCADGVKYHVLVADVDGRTVGFIAYTLDNRTKTGEIQLIAVHPEHQKRGIATELCHHALRGMETRGMTFARVETGADPSHAAARQAYEKAGFVGLPLVRYFRTL